MLWALFSQAVFIPKQNSVHAQVTFHSRTLHSKVKALIDSRATESFISPALIYHFTISICTIQWLKKLYRCLAVLKRSTCNKSNKLHNNMRIIYTIHQEDDVLVGVTWS